MLVIRTLLGNLERYSKPRYSSILSESEKFEKACDMPRRILEKQRLSREN